MGGKTGMQNYDPFYYFQARQGALLKTIWACYSLKSLLAAICTFLSHSYSSVDWGRGGYLVVSVPTVHTYDLSSNPTEGFSFFMLNCCYERMKK